jgi:hypothetical protein
MEVESELSLAIVELRMHNPSPLDDLKKVCPSEQEADGPFLELDST